MADNTLNPALLEMERANWEMTKNVNSADAYKAFLTIFPNGPHADDARKQLEELERIAREKAEAEARARAEAEARARAEAEARARAEAEAKAKAEARAEAERKAREEETRKAEAVRKAQQKQSASFDDTLIYDSDDASQPDPVWLMVDKTNRDSLERYITEFPMGTHVKEARNLISKIGRTVVRRSVSLQQLRSYVRRIETDNTIGDKTKKIYELITEFIDNNNINADILVTAINQDPNFLRASVLRDLINHGYLFDAHLDRMKVKNEFKDALEDSTMERVEFGMPTPVTCVSKTPCEEVYFWGIPSSGKSCALGGIMSVAAGGEVALSMKKDGSCQGYGYMIKLASLFSPDKYVCTLPPGTPMTAIYEMGFDLEDADGLSHPITCIDLAGELMRCMHKDLADETMDDQALESFDQMHQILIGNRTENQKIHVFVMEYGGQHRTYEGLTQKEYLDSALEYIDNTGIFHKNTDAIIILITKADIAKAEAARQHKELGVVLREFVESNYMGFINGMKRICREYEINGGEVPIMPFSVGEVCFQDFCKFDDTTSAMFVDKVLLGRSKGFRNDKIGKLSKLFRK